MSKKSQQKKPRNMFVSLNVEPGSEVKFLWDEAAQTMSYTVSKDGKVTQPVFTQVGLWYKRESGKPQNLTRTSSVQRPPMIDLNLFLSTFADVFVIDTSFDRTVNDDDRDICAACILHFRLRLQEAPDTWVLETDPILRGLEFWHPTSLDSSPCDPENFAWRYLIQMIQQSKNYSNSNSYALIVDPHIQDHPEYNLHNIPLVDDFCLPGNFELVYASAEGASDTLLNMFFVRVDKQSKELRQLALQGKTDTLSSKILTVPGCTFFRLCLGHVKVWLREEPKQKQPKTVS